MQAGYQARVEPRVQERYDIIGRVTPETRLVVTPRAGARIGLNIDVLAVHVPGQFFADVTADAPSFAGAELATARGAPLPPDDATPSEVMRAYVQAVKAGDEKNWLALHTDWVAMGGEGGRPLFRPYQPYKNYIGDYTRARNLLLHKVSDVQPLWESDPRVVIAGDGPAGLPHVEQVSVLLDHVGHFDDENRVSHPDVHRLWQLRGRDGGPGASVSRNAL